RRPQHPAIPAALRRDWTVSGRGWRPRGLSLTFEYACATGELNCAHQKVEWRRRRIDRPQIARMGNRSVRDDAEQFKNQAAGFRHGEENSDAHIKASIV